MSAIKTQIDAMFKNKQNYPYIATFIFGAVIALAANFLIGQMVNRDKVVVNLKQKKVKNDTIIAKVDKVPVYLQETNNKLHKINPNIEFSSLNEEGKQLIVTEIGIEKIILQKALKSKKAKNTDNNENLKDVTSAQISQNYLTIKAEEDISEKQIKDQYNKLVDDLKGKTEYKIRHILVKNEADSRKAMQELYKNSFAEVAKELSIDKQTAANGGELGYIVSGSMKPEIEKVISKLEVNKVSKPFKTDMGWHIIMLEDKRSASPADYEDVREIILNSLVMEEKRNIVKELAEKVKVEMF